LNRRVLFRWQDADAQRVGGISGDYGFVPAGGELHRIAVFFPAADVFAMGWVGQVG
jgi:hypothetical protein